MDWVQGASRHVVLRLLSLAFLVNGKDPPCPEDATVISCSDWCKTVYPGSRATMSGSSCARLSPQDVKKGMGPSCTCYDSGYENELKSCRSKCPVEEEVTEAPVDTTACFGSTGRDTCRADQLVSSERFLLYDVKPGEGFNLQREVFPRVGWIVAQLNAASKQWCDGKRCPTWTLVLPPWCRLAHWRRSSEEHVPWERFFDAAALRSTNISVMEFYEFVAKAGGPNVDLVVSTTTERQSRNQMMSKPRKSGGFYGFARTAQQCFTAATGLKPPRQEWMSQDMRWRVIYSGSCAEGVAAIDHRCAVLADSSARDWVDLVLASMREGARSVLLKAADAVSPPSKDELDQLRLREAMLFAAHIRDTGERYLQEVLDSKPFLSVHCRRTDFLRAREATTPSVEAVAEQLELALADFGLQQVYVATDAPDDLRQILRSQVRTGRIFFLEDLKGLADSGLLEGELAAIEMWIAARATAFIGTQESRFTMHIQTERSWLGKSFETSNRELCKSLASRRCLSPYYKSAGRRGSQHKDYWEPKVA